MTVRSLQKCTSLAVPTPDVGGTKAVWGLLPQEASVPCPDFIFGPLHGFGYANVKVLRTNLCMMPVYTHSTSDMKFLLKQRGQWEQKHRNRVCPRQIRSVTGLRLVSVVASRR